MLFLDGGSARLSRRRLASGSARAWSVAPFENSPLTQPRPPATHFSKQTASTRRTMGPDARRPACASGLVASRGSRSNSDSTMMRARPLPCASRAAPGHVCLSRGPDAREPRTGFTRASPPKDQWNTSIWRANGPKRNQRDALLDHRDASPQLELELEPNRYLKLAQS